LDDGKRILDASAFAKATSDKRYLMLDARCSSLVNWLGGQVVICQMDHRVNGRGRRSGRRFFRFSSLQGYYTLFEFLRSNKLFGLQERDVLKEIRRVLACPAFAASGEAQLLRKGCIRVRNGVYCVSAAIY